MPEPGELTDEDTELLRQIESGFQSVAEEMEAVHLRAALAEAMRLATEVNRYLDMTAPWQAIKTDRAAAARSIYTAIRAIDSIENYCWPRSCRLPAKSCMSSWAIPSPCLAPRARTSVSDSLGTHTILRYAADQACGEWAPSQIEAGRPLVQPGPLFKKLDIKIVEEERARLGQPKGS